MTEGGKQPFWSHPSVVDRPCVTFGEQDQEVWWAKFNVRHSTHNWSFRRRVAYTQVNDYQLRSAVQDNLVISYCRTKRYGQRSFAYSGLALWNSLPLTVRDPSLSLTLQLGHQLKSVCFLEHNDTLRIHSASVTAYRL